MDKDQLANKFCNYVRRVRMKVWYLYCTKRCPFQKFIENIGTLSQLGGGGSLAISTFDQSIICLGNTDKYKDQNEQNKSAE